MARHPWRRWLPKGPARRLAAEVHPWRVCYVPLHQRVSSCVCSNQKRFGGWPVKESDHSARQSPYSLSSRLRPIRTRPTSSQSLAVNKLRQFYATAFSFVLGGWGGPSRRRCQSSIISLCRYSTHTWPYDGSFPSLVSVRWCATVCHSRANCSGCSIYRLIHSLNAVACCFGSHSIAFIICFHVSLLPFV